MRFWILLFTLTVFFSCDKELSVEKPNKPEKMCDKTHLAGTYTMFNETDTSSKPVELTVVGDSIFTTGLSGYGFWFPASPLSGRIENCNISIHEYKDVRRRGLDSPGGNKRYYKESMSGNGEYFPENDSLSLYINYKRTEGWTVDYSGKIFLVKQ